MFILNVLIWYASSSFFNVAFKKANVSFITMTSLQFFIGGTFSLFVTHIPCKASKISAILFWIGNIATNYALMFNTATEVQTLKMTDPIFAYVLSKLYNSEKISINAESVSIICFFVVTILSCYNSIHGQVVFYIFLSNITLQFRNVINKKLVETTDPSTVLFNTFLYATPFQLSLELFKKTTWNSLNVYIILSPLFFILYQYMSILVLEQCSNVTHAYLNIGKRIVILFISLLYELNSVTEDVVINSILFTLLCSSYYLSKLKHTNISMTLCLFSFIMCILNLARTNKYMTPHQKICLNHYNFVPYEYNLGDNAGIDIIKAMTSCRITSVHKSVSQYEPLIIGLGSTMHHLKSAVIWGTGAMEQSNHVYNLHGEFDVRALRGKLTERLLKTSSVRIIPNNQSIAFGDPGLLIPCLLSHMYRICKPTYKFCLVPHNNDRLYFSKHLHSNVSVKIINTNNDYKDSLRMLMNCNLVLSSSLHGIIFAEAFGIPSRWLSNNNLPSFVTERRFKYCDYYSGSRNSIVIGDECMNNKGEYTNAETIEEGIRMGGAPTLQNSNSRDLMKSFPFDKIQDCKVNHCNLRFDELQIIGKKRACSDA